MSDCDNITIKNCNIKDNYNSFTSIDGIRLNNCNNSKIIDNIIIGLAIQIMDYGIYLDTSNYNNIITGNTVNDHIDGVGIYIDHRNSNNNISRNTVNNNEVGIALSNNINLDGNNIISNNTVKDNYFGIHQHLSDYNNISNNNVISNTYGIYISQSHFNNISHNNTISENNNTINNNGLGGVYYL